MKLIQQTSLHFRDGNSDKVYEVDLCEVSTNTYVVNFRYGRRGANLKEGTKTTTPVPRAEADKAFNALVNEKTKKGYLTVGTQGGAPPPPKRVLPHNADAREQAILKQLSTPVPSKPKWSLSRVIWRAGELKIRAAAPFLIKLIGSGDALRDYCLAWSLGWCGDETAISALGRMLDDEKQPDHVRRIAREAVRKLLSENARQEWQEKCVATLPIELRDVATHGTSKQFSLALQAYLSGATAPRFEVLHLLYLIDNDITRPALLELLRTAPLNPNYFKHLRHIFKAAEYRRDAEAFGLIAYRFEKERAMFGQWYQSQWNRETSLNGQTVYSPHRLSDELKKPDAQYAYSGNTRRYLRKRVWRTLRRLGQLDDANDYVKMAVGVLLPYSDNDAQAVRISDRYQANPLPNNRWNSDVITTTWDSFAGYYAFNHVLYLQSQRYAIKPQGMGFYCRPNYQPGSAEPTIREEAFPKLWEAQPVGLLHLLSESNCERVHHFAVKALAASQEYCAQLDAEVVTMLLARPYEVTARFGFALAQKLYDAVQPDRDLVLAVANANFVEAREQAQRWIDEGRHHFLSDNQFLLRLVTSKYADTREFARNLLRTSALPDEAAKTLIAQIIAEIFAIREANDSDIIKDAAQTLLVAFSPQLRTINLNVVLDLLAHPLLVAQEFGGNILLHHETPADALPAGIISSLLSSEFAEMRGIGIRLFGQLPEEKLLAQEKLLIDFSTHELADVRNASRPVIQRLNRHREFTNGMAALFVELLLQREMHEGTHAHLVTLLKEDLGTEWQAEIDKDKAMQLLGTRSHAAQDLVGWLIGEKIKTEKSFAETFTTRDIIKLSRHEIIAVRQAAQTIFVNVINRFKANNDRAVREMMQAVQLLDTKWEESRAFYFQAFREHFTGEDLTPATLVAMCDSVRPDVQSFGRELITKYFAEADGQEYLLKLSEHPSADLQLFATNYLERFAADDATRLRSLTPYFVSVLSRVNRARVAKDRVLNFLANEASKSAEAAAIVAQILTRQSVTMAIGDKAKTIEAMLNIHQQFPTIDVPLQRQTAEVRHAI